MMTKKYFPLAIVAFLTTTLASCSAIEGIFKAGMWAGVIGVVVVLALVIWVISKIFGGGSRN
jgi:cytosine/uracil/thiamine/allantoin permease